MEKSIVEFHIHFYTNAIQKLSLNFPHKYIIGTHQFGHTLREAFKNCSDYQDVLCHLNDAELVVSSFAHQIKSEYYVGNISMSIEGIEL